MSVSLVTGFAGESHITSEQIARFNASVFGSGEYVATGAGKTISASLQSANTVRVMPGDIMMKGRHIVVDSAQDLSIENGSQALKRNDLIVCRYEKNSSTGVETASLDVIKGTPGEIAVDPNYVSGDLLNGGALINEMPLFRISLDGLAVQEPVPLFSKYLLRGDQIADNAITTEKIANGTITASDLSSDLAGRITDLEAAWDSVSRRVLYENPSGIKGNFTLAESAGNFARLTFYFKNDDGLSSSVDVDSPDGKTVALSMSSSGDTGYLWFVLTALDIAGTSCSINTKHAPGQLGFYNSGALARENVNHIAVTKVVGYLAL